MNLATLGKYHPFIRTHDFHEALCEIGEDARGKNPLTLQHSPQARKNLTDFGLVFLHSSIDKWSGSARGSHRPVPTPFLESTSTSGTRRHEVRERWLLDLGVFFIFRENGCEHWKIPDFHRSKSEEFLEVPKTDRAD